jgi:hypothetical protein
MSNDFEHWNDEEPHSTGEFPQVFSGTPSTKSGKSRWIGLVLMLASIGFTVGTIALLLTQDSPEPTPTPEPPTQIISVAEDTLPTDEAPTIAATPTDMIVDPTHSPSQQDDNTRVVANILPTIAPDAAAVLLNQPITQLANRPAGIGEIPLDPFTIVPVRPRTEVIRHTVVADETIDNIAARYNISTDSIAWSNSREIIQRFLRPGDILNIPPEDGVYIQAVGSLRTFRDYAELYGVDDPFVILDSPYNPTLRDYGPDDVAPDGTYIFITGGVSFDVVWPAAIEIVEQVVSGSGNTGRATQGDGTVSLVTFQNGHAGSCAAQPAEGASFWSNPLAGSSYRFVRGFASFHPALDLAASPGTPIRAANGGRVVFSGWNNNGYGYMVAIVHGPSMTVYAHMVGQPFVTCGQVVASGDTIGQVGSTGISSGPHLHFEVRTRQGNTYAPVDPYSIGIGF